MGAGGLQEGQELVQLLEPRRSRQLNRLGYASRRPQRAGHEPGHDVATDVGEHHRGDDLVRPHPRLEHRRNEGPGRARQRAADEYDRDGDGHRVARELDPEESGRESSEEELSLGADVEQTRAETVGDCQAGEDERRGPQQRLPYLTLAAECPLEHRRERRHRAVPRQPDDDRADEHSDGNRHEGCGDANQPVEPLLLEGEALLRGLGRLRRA